MSHRGFHHLYTAPDLKIDGVTIYTRRDPFHISYGITEYEKATSRLKAPGDTAPLINTSGQASIATTGVPGEGKFKPSLLNNNTGSYMVESSTKYSTGQSDSRGKRGHVHDQLSGRVGEDTAPIAFMLVPEFNTYEDKVRFCETIMRRPEQSEVAVKEIRYKIASKTDGTIDEGRTFGDWPLLRNSKELSQQSQQIGCDSQSSAADPARLSGQMENSAPSDVLTRSSAAGSQSAPSQVLATGRTSYLGFSSFDDNWVNPADVNDAGASAPMSDQEFTRELNKVVGTDLAGAIEGNSDRT